MLIRVVPVERGQDLDVDIPSKVNFSQINVNETRILGNYRACTKGYFEKLSQKSM